MKLSEHIKNCAEFLALYGDGEVDFKHWQLPVKTVRGVRVVAGQDVVTKEHGIYPEVDLRVYEAVIE